MEKIYILTIVVIVVFNSASGYHGPDLPPGPYCGLGGRRGGCCEGREDRCGHEILDTICYCDQFCMRKTGDDCCPDYEAVCLGEEPPLEPQKQGICTLGNTKWNECNKCTCNMVNDEPNWECEAETCLMNPDIVRDVNRGRSTWRAGTYQQFARVNLKNAMTYKLGTLPVDETTLRMGPVHYNKDIQYPEEFDTRKTFRRFMSPIQDQGWCGSDWALTIASIISDRFAIASNGTESLKMSPQSLLSCNINRQGRPSQLINNCEGGHVDYAWNYVRRHGIVDLQCFPYEAKVTRCPYDVYKNDLRAAGCKPQVASRTERYSVSVPFRLSSEHDVMYEIMESGPVHAIMKVYQDFFHYRDGVYRNENRYGDQKMHGWHSVKIVGWGRDKNIKYWIVANTWGKDWGENGYFRILRGSNESKIESFIVAATSLLAINHKI